MLTLVSALKRNLSQAGDRSAIFNDGRRMTWAELIDRIARTAAMLLELGVTRGSTFGLVTRNSPRCFELMHAGYWIGAIPVPINFRLAAPEIAFILEHANCSLVGVESPFMAHFNSEPLIRWAGRVLSLDETPGTSGQSCQALLASAQPVDAIDPDESDVALVLYSGGTTGKSKGVPLTHRNIISNALQVSSRFHFSADEIFLHVAPMFHSADLLGTGVTLQGGSHAFLPQFSPDEFMRAVEQCRVTRTMLAPTMVMAILAAEGARDHDCSSLRQLIYGSSPMPTPAIRQLLERFPGVDLTQGYGLTETSPLLTVLTMKDHVSSLVGDPCERLRSAGQALPGVELRITDQHGRDVPSGASGEIRARGPNISPGYLNAPDETAQAFVDGWFRTGDVGRLDANGYLTILDRCKDMIITGGENVYSVEVEAILALHPKVSEVAVIGVSDERYGEALLAVVVCRPGVQVTIEELVTHCRQHIGGYKIPRLLEVVPELPRSALGKVLKTRLRQEYAADRAAGQYGEQANF
jgi:long-chain acyl-CoA synthetase